MTTKLILIEGLPGSGKTTTAKTVHEWLGTINRRAELYLEGNLEHPADYDGVACFSQTEYEELLSTARGSSGDWLRERAIRQDGDYLLEYRKLHNEPGSSIPDEWLQAAFRHDIYELPLDRNRELIANRWRKFAEKALAGPELYVFECCFIQNPVTAGMVRHGASQEEVADYVAELAAIVEPLNPLLIYVEQDDLNVSFRKAVRERPREWSEGFIQYYTGQGYGKRHGFEGLEGTLRVLEARRELELEIFNRLSMAKARVNNSAFEPEGYKRALAEILGEHLKLA